MAHTTGGLLPSAPIRLVLDFEVWQVDPCRPDLRYGQTRERGMDKQ